MTARFVPQGHGRKLGRVAGCVLLLFAWTAPDAEGQVAVSLTGGFAGFTGRDFSGTPAGPTIGGAVHLRFAELDGVEAALGVDHARYGGHGFIGATRQIDYWASIGRTVHAGRADLLVGARMGYSTRALSVVDEPAATDGFLVGPSATLRIPAPLGAAVAVGLEVAYHTYEELILYASREYGTDQDGLRLMVRAGVFVPILGGPEPESAPPRW